MQWSDALGLTANWVFAHTKRRATPASLLLMERSPQIALIKGAKDTMDPQKPDPTPLNRLEDTPQWIDCPFCHRQTQTQVEKKKLGPLKM